MVAKKKKVSGKKSRVKVGKLGTTKKLSAAEIKRVKGGATSGAGSGKAKFNEFTVTDTSDSTSS